VRGPLLCGSMASLAQPRGPVRYSGSRHLQGRCRRLPTRLPTATRLLLLIIGPAYLQETLASHELELSVGRSLLDEAYTVHHVVAGEDESQHAVVATDSSESLDTLDVLEEGDTNAPSPEVESELDEAEAFMSKLAAQSADSTGGSEEGKDVLQDRDYDTYSSYDSNSTVVLSQFFGNATDKTMVGDLDETLQLSDVRGKANNGASGRESTETDPHVTENEPRVHTNDSSAESIGLLPADTAKEAPAKMSQTMKPASVVIRPQELADRKAIQDDYDIHVVFSTECSAYFDWQTLGLVYSHKKVYEDAGLTPPPITRLMACDEQFLPWPGMHLADTHVHPNYAVHPVTHDRYTPYNKPYSIGHWLEYGSPKSQWIVFLDADMVVRRPMSISNMGVQRGRPVAAEYGYLHGVDPEVYMGVKEKVKQIQKAPFEKVGGFFVYHVDDLRAVAPLWLQYTEEVRQDPNSWANTGDIFNRNGAGGPPWISEMYGYVFGAAVAGMKHTVSNHMILYPSYDVTMGEPYPLVLHYGLTFSAMDFPFDKHWHKGAKQYAACDGKLFPTPPEYSEIKLPEGSGLYKREMVSLYCIRTLYEAQLDYYLRHCMNLTTENVTALTPTSRQSLIDQIGKPCNHCYMKLAFVRQTGFFAVLLS